MWNPSHLMSLLDERDRVEQAPFADLLAAYTTSQQTISYQSSTITEHETSLQTLKAKLSQTLSSLSHYQQSGVNITDLNNQLESLKSERKELLKKQGYHATRILELSDQVVVLESVVMNKHDENKRLTESIKSLSKRLSDAEALLSAKNQHIEMLQDELSTTHLELSQKESQLTHLQTENKTLVDRWLRKCSEEAEKLNEVNAFLESAVSPNSSSPPIITTPSATPRIHKIISRHPGRLQLHVPTPTTPYTFFHTDSTPLLSYLHLPTNTIRSQLSLKSRITAIASSEFTPGSHAGKLAISTRNDEGRIRIYNARFELVQTLQGHLHPPHRTLFTTPTTLTTLSTDQTLKYYDITKQFPEALQTHYIGKTSTHSDITSINTNSIIISTPKKLCLLDVRGKSVSRVVDEGLLGSEPGFVIPDGNRLFVQFVDGGVRELDTRVWRFVNGLEADTLDPRVRCLVVGKALWGVGFRDGIVKEVDVGGNQWRMKNVEGIGNISGMKCTDLAGVEGGVCVGFMKE